MKSLAIALMAALFAVPASAFARDHGDHGDHGRGADHAGFPQGYPGRGEPSGGFRPGPPPGYGGPVPGGYHYNYPPPRFDRGGPPVGRQTRYRDPDDWNEFSPAGAGPSRWRRGQFLPPPFRGDMVGDYSRYHLRRPPPGYFWYRSGDDYILAAIASGLIFEVVAGEGD